MSTSIKQAQKLIKSEKYNEALELLQNLEGHTYQSHLFLALVYERLENFKSQFQALKLAVNSLEGTPIENCEKQKLAAYKGVCKVFPKIEKINDVEDLRLFLESFKSINTDLLASQETVYNLVEKAVSGNIRFESIPVFLEYGFTQEVLAKTGFYKDIPLNVVFDETIEMGKNSGMKCKIKNKVLGELLYSRLAK